ncbi:MAG TPA: YihY/virulence factor BrkB family protein [Solirubrobacteraceae bacterium]
MATIEAQQRKDVGPDDIPKPGWKAILKRTAKEFQNDNLTDWAAALTYYAVLALFPALIVLVALVGLFGQYPQTTDALLNILRDVGVQSSTLDSLKDTINNVIQNKGGAGALLGVGLLGALWSASAYIGAFMRASNAIFEKPEGRPFWKLRPLQVLVTLAMTLLLALVLIALVISGPLAEAVGRQIGLGGTAVTVWDIAKWPILAFVVAFMLAVLYYAAPNARLPKFQWISPGAIVALVVWVVASFGFFMYANNFGSYDKTYGTLGAAITLLVWLWLSNLAVLFGQELNAEVERGRELAAGQPAIDDIQLPLRGKPKKDPEEQAAAISREAVTGAGNGGAKHDDAVGRLSREPVEAGGNGGTKRDEAVAHLGTESAAAGQEKSTDRPR